MTVPFEYLAKAILAGTHDLALKRALAAIDAADHAAFESGLLYAILTALPDWLRDLLHQDEERERAADPRPECRCNCGYRCGGPGRCKLSIMECLGQSEGHFVTDCDHDNKGPVWESEDRCARSITCSKCGQIMMHHDMQFGP